MLRPLKAPSTLRRNFPLALTVALVIVGYILFSHIRYKSGLLTYIPAISNKKVSFYNSNKKVSFYKTSSPHPTGKKVEKRPLACTLTNNTTADNITFGKQITPPYLPMFKNPCWKPVGYPDTLCTPYVILAGFPKCGTTDLHSRITAHPLVSISITKEPHYLTRQVHELYGPRFNKSSCCMLIYRAQNFMETWCSPGFLKTAKTSCEIMAYAKVYFTGDVRNIFRGKKKAKKGEDDEIHLRRDTDKSQETEHRKDTEQQDRYKYEMVTIDASASTAWDNTFWIESQREAGCDEVFAFTPPFVHRMNPRAKVIMILRDPIERTYSDFAYFTRNSVSPGVFHDHTVRYLDKFKKCMHDHSSVRTCAYYTQQKYAIARHSVSLYHVYVKEWLDIFPRKNLLFVKSENYRDNIASHLHKIYDFLELPELDDISLAKVAERTNVNTNTNKTRVGDMWPQTRELLQDFYQPHNDLLAQVLDDETFTWKYDNS